MTKKKKQKLSHAELEKQLRTIFIGKPKKLYTTKQLIAKLKLKNDPDGVQSIINKLHNEHFIFEVKNGHYRLDRYTEFPPKKKSESRKKSKQKTNGNKNILTGIVDRTKQGSAYIVTENEQQDDIYVSQKRLGWALHGDTVKVRLLKSRRRRPEGKIIEVLKRRTDQFIGKLSRYKNRSEVHVDDGKIPFEIIVNNSDIKEAGNKEMVLVEITDWPTRSSQSPIGKVLELLGDRSNNDIEMNSILLKYGFDIHFPDEVLREADALSAEIDKEEIAGRRDMRDVLTFTIDPDTAKDFDDAISLQKYDNGNYEIGIHIADVSHYVRPGSKLDEEALRRSTSVYLVDRVCPMLPEQLSNELCSLRPHEEKLTFSAVFTFNSSHKIIKRWFGRTITYSDRRFTYEEAQDRIDTGKGDHADEIRFLNSVSSRLRNQRFKHGSINFETEEVKFILDEEGKPIDIQVKEHIQAHELIEDLMLLANKEVATYIYKKGEKTAPIPFIYRVHDEPDMEKVREFGLFASELGVNLELQNPNQIPKAYNLLTSRIEDQDLVNILQPLAIRTMAKAEYSTENIGHFGLGFDYYTHFTSPIRRYADVLVHRILAKNLHGDYRMDKRKLEKMAQHISAQERNAMDAERESISFKQAEFLQNSIGKTFKGLVSGLIERGFFVELTASLCEGLVDWDSLNEHYVLNENRLKARSKQSGKTISMGTKVIVRIDAVNLERREVDMSLEQLI